MSLRFRFAGSRPPAINPAWLKVLAASADSGPGLHVLPVPASVTGVSAPEVRG